MTLSVGYVTGTSMYFVLTCRYWFNLLKFEITLRSFPLKHEGVSLNPNFFSLGHVLCE